MFLLPKEHAERELDETCKEPGERAERELAAAMGRRNEDDLSNVVARQEIDDFKQLSLRLGTQAKLRRGEYLRTGSTAYPHPPGSSCCR